MTGVVYIVGAGPGDPGLMTVKGLGCLHDSDVVIHDRLVHPRILDEARHDAEIIDVGKQPGRSHQIQGWINTLLVSKAKEGQTVCRLKGGDPFIFGRGAEEVRVLAEAGIRFEVVPGVSSISAVPASVGIPLTHRDMTHAFMVVTACHASTDSEDWTLAADMVRRGGTLVILMGLARMLDIASALCGHGCDASTPVAVISSGTLPNQQSRYGTLQDICDNVTGLRPPALIVIGKVASCRAKTLQSLPSAPANCCA